MVKRLLSTPETVAAYSWFMVGGFIEYLLHGKGKNTGLATC